MAFDGRFKLMIGRTEKTDASGCCDADMQCIRPSHETIDTDYTTVPCGVDEQGFDAPGMDALYDLQYDPKVRKGKRADWDTCVPACLSLWCRSCSPASLSQEVINLLRSPYVHKPLSQLHADAAGTEDGKIVPYDKARSLQTTLVGWLQRTGSEYASAVGKRQMNTTHINQVPMLAAAMPSEIAWRVGEDNILHLPPGAFLDVDHDQLIYTGSLDRDVLPHWLQVHPSDGSVFGKPPSRGSHLLRVTATDQKVGGAFVEVLLKVE